ncbi:hypothetical protein HRbin17_00500 [bacterium HR17]|uniref:Uncharacterized protein n=1 Tax=Candidatus Fervidibacter japonicus TaxID=2035412 RepID=A0A2H5XA19_9BACT|nr:hypothetical protein HRbin17_00500 [bacterium HR17]
MPVTMPLAIRGEEWRHHIRVQGNAKPDGDIDLVVASNAEAPADLAAIGKPLTEDNLRTCSPDLAGTAPYCCVE